jgi:hypothetical protein
MTIEERIARAREFANKASRLREDFDYFRDPASQPGLAREAAALFPDLSRDLPAFADALEEAVKQIKDAPHDARCTPRLNACDCWKSEALAAIESKLKDSTQ